VETNGKLRLRGKVMSDGGSTPTEVGFILSRTLAIDPADPNLVRLEATLSEGNFTLLAQPPESLGKEIYYCAYARNSSGETHGTVKRISLSGNPESAQSWLTGSEETTAGWRNSSWFGSFYKTSTPWLYHKDLGWLYALDDGAGNAWLWHESHGWLWTGKDLFRHLYRSRDGIWLYFLKRKDGHPYFYNHTTKQVE
jgi:hypothetical protein